MFVLLPCLLKSLTFLSSGSRERRVLADLEYQRDELEAYLANLRQVQPRVLQGGEEQTSGGPDA